MMGNNEHIDGRTHKLLYLIEYNIWAQERIIIGGARTVCTHYMLPPSIHMFTCITSRIQHALILLTRRALLIK